jgi:IS5 family transposase
MRTARGERGQSTVEVVALLPLMLVVLLAAAQLLLAGLAREQAGTAAQAAAMALLQGDNPETAARDALPGWARSRVHVRVRGRRTEVRLRPPAVVPRLGGALTATVRADAGPEPRP